MVTKNISRAIITAVFLLCVGFFASTTASANIQPDSGGGTTGGTNSTTAGTASAPSNGAKNKCGDGEDATYTAIDIGCKGLGNPIVDALFAIIRFLSNGVGLIVIGSIIVGGIQYTSSRGDPQATAKAIERIRASVVALIIFIFGYAILNYLIPAGFLK